MWATFTWRAALSPGRRTHSALAQLRCILDGELEGIRGAGTWKNERVITSRQGPCIRVDGMSGGNFPFWESSYLVRRPRARPRLACGGHWVGVGERHVHYELLVCLGKYYGLLVLTPPV